MTATLALVEAEAVEDAVAAVALLAAYCCRALMNSDSSCTPSVDAVAALEALVDVESLLVELAVLVELVLEVELAEAMASAGGSPPPWW